MSNNLCGFWTVKQVDPHANTGLAVNNVLYVSVSENGPTTVIKKVGDSDWVATCTPGQPGNGDYNGQDFKIWRENSLPKATLCCEYTYYIPLEPWQLLAIGSAGLVLGFIVGLICGVGVLSAGLISFGAAVGSTLAAKLLIKTQSNSTWMAEEGGAPLRLPGEPPVIEEEEPVLRRVGGRRG
ncbi:MAG TPA: hypothetical protein VN493_24955 [Thermoanaerobaculia bacterium]|nr:hypothetical protein [Thermoanaerobaculia bacterium]